MLASRLSELIAPGDVTKKLAFFFGRFSRRPVPTARATLVTPSPCVALLCVMPSSSTLSPCSSSLSSLKVGIVAGSNFAHMLLAAGEHEPPKLLRTVFGLQSKPAVRSSELRKPCCEGANSWAGVASPCELPTACELLKLKEFSSVSCESLRSWELSWAPPCSCEPLRTCESPKADVLLEPWVLLKSRGWLKSLELLRPHELPKPCEVFKS
mmetsp:Transcript_10766/g.20883  ORF Transcript_10766/g.20883 Transcript_10766/m.20883 type:complete len:211 (-) Transcript_10766:569-1201(-)